MSFLNFFNSPKVSIFHQVVKPPYGGGNQFTIALSKELKRRGFPVEFNRISRSSKVCLFNSYNFDFQKLRSLKRSNCRMVHRVDGPISVYRGRDEGIDLEINRINLELADATIFQSNFSYEKHLDLGLVFKDPVIIINASDPDLFHPYGRATFDPCRKTRLVSVSWSDNVKKGGETYQWLERHLDWSRFEYTFIGRSRFKFDKIITVAPVPSETLADILRKQDIFITASQDDPCSNALIEALSCGLPSVYLKSGGHSEIAGKGGEGFVSNEEALETIEQVAANYHEYQESISLPGLSGTVDSYLEVFGFVNEN